MFIDIAGEAAPGTVEDLGVVDDGSVDVLWLGEMRHDAFVQSSTALMGTEHVRVGTGIAAAFARTPMTVAYQANDLHLGSSGRFVLGLGTQVKPHIERRFSMPWSKPAARMAEFVEAVRAIWHSWETGEALDFRGSFYEHTLMTEFFSPGPNPYGNPLIYMGGVGPLMVAIAGSVADGLLTHAFSTEKYVREVTHPLLTTAASEAGRTVDLNVNVFVVASGNPEHLRERREDARRRVAFYGSTPAYRAVLELHDWGSVSDELTALSRGDDPSRWDRMSDLVNDDVLDEFVVTGTVADVAAALMQRYDGLADRLTLSSPSSGPLDGLLAVASAMTLPNRSGAA